MLMFVCNLKQQYIDILIIYFMSVAPLKLTELNRQHNDSQGPSTPKKKPKYIDEQLQTKRRVKSITRLVEKQSTNFMYSFLVLVWALFVGGAIFMSYQTKIQEIEINADRHIHQCRKDYEINRCDAPVKAAVLFCSQKQACMREQANKLAERSINYMAILGQIGRDFLNGAGLFGASVGVLLVWLSMRQKGLNRTITNVQYYQDR